MTKILVCIVFLTMLLLRQYGKNRALWGMWWGIPRVQLVYNQVYEFIKTRDLYFEYLCRSLGVPAHLLRGRDE